jgi:diguanylate cyclase (GGDEF)-like protein
VSSEQILDAADMVDGLRALGGALSARCDDIVTKQQSLSGSSQFSSAHQVQSRGAVQSLVASLTTGEPAEPERMEALVELGGQQMVSEAISVGTATRMCFAWRDAVIEVLREESRRLDLAPSVLAAAVQAARTGSDAFLVRLGDRFDAQRWALQAALDERTNELAHRAFHDPLTGLANRAQFFEQLAFDCETAIDARPCALVYVDLDGFKQVNDTFGHHVGDQILVTAAERLSHLVRPGDLVARLGGDEFVVLCRNVSDDMLGVVTGVAQRIRAAFTSPFDVGGTLVSVPASVGVAVKTPDATDAEQLLAIADAAMYIAKRNASRRGSYAVRS